MNSVNNRSRETENYMSIGACESLDLNFKTSDTNSNKKKDGLLRIPPSSNYEEAV